MARIVDTYTGVYKGGDTSGLPVTVRKATVEDLTQKFGLSLKEASEVLKNQERANRRSRRSDGPTPA